MARRAQPVATFSDPLLLQVANVPLIIHEIQGFFGIAQRDCIAQLHSAIAQVSCGKTKLIYAEMIFRAGMFIPD